MISAVRVLQERRNYINLLLGTYLAEEKELEAKMTQVKHNVAHYSRDAKELDAAIAKLESIGDA